MVASKRNEFAKEQTVLLMEKGIDLTNRRMVVGIPYMEHNTDNDVSFPLAANFFSGLEVLERFYVPPATGDAKDHIDLIFTSYGGDTYLSKGIFDRIVMSTVPIDIYVYGPCMSGGSLIMQACRRRYISPNSRLMLHYGFTGDEGTSDPRRLKRVIKEHNDLMDKLVGIYLSRCNEQELAADMLEKIVKRVSKLFRNDSEIERFLRARANEHALAENMLRYEILPFETYLDAETCVRYGFADEIIDPTLPA